MCGSIARDMLVFASVNDPEVARILSTGGVGVLRTDTLYGLVASADNESAVNRVFSIKGRDDNKSPILLIDSISQMYDEISDVSAAFIHAVWPGRVSVIVPSGRAPTWITRGNASVAYRMPAVEMLRGLLKSAGPLIAPSANPQGHQPAMSVEEAQRYFGDTVDFYVDGGVVEDPQPSELHRIRGDGTIERLR
jgi:L-threonylcarbamoyladenylate synthase